MAKRHAGKTGSTKTQNARRKADEPTWPEDDIDRAYVLVKAYQSFVCRNLHVNRKGAPDKRLPNIPDDELKSVDSIERLLRSWLPAAIQAGAKILAPVLKLTGDRVAARKLLGDRDLEAEKLDQIRQVADGVAARLSSPPDAAAAARRALDRFRAARPKARKLLSKDRSVRLGSDYESLWTADLTRFTSIPGTSFRLAATLDRLATHARALDESIDIDASLRLSQCLRERPREIGARDEDDLDRVMELADEAEVAIKHVEARVAAERAQKLAKQTGRHGKKAESIDDKGYELLCTAWDESPPEHRERPTWTQLAEGVKKQLDLQQELSSIIQTLKQRSPRTRAKWDAIGAEMESAKQWRINQRPENREDA